jgi:hypothetical protein
MNRDVVEPDFAGEQITRDTRTCDLKIAEGEKPRTVGAVLDLLKADISCSNKMVDSWYEERLSRISTC